MRSLFSLCALALFAGGVIAADPEPQKFYLIDGKVTTEARVTELEKRVADLEAKLAKYEKVTAKPSCVCGPDCKCDPTDCPGKCPVVTAAVKPVADALPAYLTIGGQLHQRGTDGTYYPLSGPAAPTHSYPAFGGSSCPGGNCRLK